MDEYVGLFKTHTQSYHYFMHKNFFNHIDIKYENINILNSMAKELEKECQSYEKKIEDVGGIDIFLGGVGEDGHIVFNEPGSNFSSKTRIKTLTYNTREANSRFFGGDVTSVPKTALTVGLRTIMQAKQVIILVCEEKKARALHHTIERGLNHMWTLSCLQNHERGIIICDEGATLDLKVRTVKYFKNIKKYNVNPNKIQLKNLSTIKMASPVRFEHTTFSLGGNCSILLSYGDTSII